MKKILLSGLLLSLLSFNNTQGICHDCELWISEGRKGKVRATLTGIACSLKRLVTRRRCCCRDCYKNNPSYRVKITTVFKDKSVQGMTRCNRCGKHHICHSCKRRLCLSYCNDHDLPSNNPVPAKKDKPEVKP